MTADLMMSLKKIARTQLKSSSKRLLQAPAPLKLPDARCNQQRSQRPWSRSVAPSVAFWLAQGSLACWLGKNWEICGSDPDRANRSPGGQSSLSISRVEGRDRILGAQDRDAGANAHPGSGLRYSRWPLRSQTFAALRANDPLAQCPRGKQSERSESGVMLWIHSYRYS